jgi:hypothetical protein
MTKRRRQGASKKLAEARFWGAPVPAGASDPAGAAEGAEPGGTDPAGTASIGTAPAGAATGRPEPLPRVRPTPDPGALVRSLGPPPLAVDSAVAERHLTAVYEEAVRTATALAAANGLLALDDREA